MTKRVDAASVVAAYQSTGLAPIRCAFSETDDSSSVVAGCALAAVHAAHNGCSRAIRDPEAPESFEHFDAAMDLEPGYALGFAAGWDTDPQWFSLNEVASRAYILAQQDVPYHRGVIDGIAARLAMRDAGLEVE